MISRHRQGPWSALVPASPWHAWPGLEWVIIVQELSLTTIKAQLLSCCFFVCLGTLLEGR